MAVVNGEFPEKSVSPGDPVQEGQREASLESTKMEIPVEFPVAGTMVEIGCQEGGTVSAGQILCVLEPHDV